MCQITITSAWALRCAMHRHVLDHALRMSGWVAGSLARVGPVEGKEARAVFLLIISSRQSIAVAGGNHGSERAVVDSVLCHGGLVWTPNFGAQADSVGQKCILDSSNADSNGQLDI